MSETESYIRGLVSIPALARDLGKDRKILLNVCRSAGILHPWGKQYRVNREEALVALANQRVVDAPKVKAQKRVLHPDVKC